VGVVALKTCALVKLLALRFFILFLLLDFVGVLLWAHLVLMLLFDVGERVLLV
jgi:hypothetical protein